MRTTTGFTNHRADCRGSRNFWNTNVEVSGTASWFCAISAMTITGFVHHICSVKWLSLRRYLSFAQCSGCLSQGCDLHFSVNNRVSLASIGIDAHLKEFVRKLCRELRLMLSKWQESTRTLLWSNNTVAPSTRTKNISSTKDRTRKTTSPTRISYRTISGKISRAPFKISKTENTSWMRRLKYVLWATFTNSWWSTLDSVERQFHSYMCSCHGKVKLAILTYLKPCVKSSHWMVGHLWLTTK